MTMMKTKSRWAILLVMAALVSSLNFHATGLSGKDNSAIAGQQVAVYLTAAETSYRLSPTDKLGFTEFGQPLETQACVFVDQDTHLAAAATTCCTTSR